MNPSRVRYVPLRRSFITGIYVLIYKYFTPPKHQNSVYIKQSDDFKNPIIPNIYKQKHQRGKIFIENI